MWMIWLACAPAPRETGQETGPSEREAYSIKGMVWNGEGGALQLRAESATPDPPNEGLNTWWVRVLDADGAEAPEPGIALTPSMPTHNHGTLPPTFTGVPTEDSLEIGPMNLMMPGRWEISAEITSGQETVDHLVFALWLEG